MALYDVISTLSWAEAEGMSIVGPELISQNTKKFTLIRVRLRMVESQQKSYAYRRGWPLEFQVGDFVSRRLVLKEGN